MRRWSPRNPAHPSASDIETVSGSSDGIEPDIALAREYAVDPFGEPSPALKRLLDAMRDEPPEGRLVLVETVPGQLWTVARLTGRRGEAPIPVGTNTISSRAEGAAAIFRLRWERLFGRGPDV